MIAGELVRTRKALNQAKAKLAVAVRHPDVHQVHRAGAAARARNRARKASSDRSGP
jgi:hypothetical protein